MKEKISNGENKHLCNRKVYKFRYERLIIEGEIFD